MAFAAGMLEELGFESFPASDEKRSDIIQTIRLKTADNLVKFCQGIQKGSPVDSFALPVPAPMPGYVSPVVMAAGTCASRISAFCRAGLRMNPASSAC